MSLYVVDVSVGVKWMLPEPYSMEAQRLQDPAHQLHSPAFFTVELANILWKKIRQSLLTRAQANLMLGQVSALPLTFHDDKGLLISAFNLADQTRRTVYDCLYLALAIHLGGQMVTADEKLVNALSGTPWAGSALWVANLP